MEVSLTGKGASVAIIALWQVAAMALVVVAAGLLFVAIARRLARRAAGIVAAVGVFVTALAAALTGRVLPWDQLAIWAITVGSNMASATPLIGIQGPGTALLKIGDIQLVTSTNDARFGLLGARFVGEETLNRFYVLHCVAIPLAAALLMAIHFWRIRKDGGISGPL